MKPTTIHAGESLYLDVRLDVEGISYIFNPTFNPLLMRPATLALFNSRHEYLGDLIQFTVGSQRTPTAADFVWFQTPAYVGCKLGVAMHDPRNGGFGTTPPLPNGTYYLQMIYNERATASPPNDLNDRAAIEHWYLSPQGTDSFRSNIVRFEYIDRPRSSVANAAPWNWLHKVFKK